MIASTFCYNLIVTGTLWRFPLWILGGSNQFGFGSRNIVPGSAPFAATPGRSFRALGANLSAFPQWYSGGIFIVAIAGLGLWRIRRQPLALLLATICVVVPLGYVLYWGNILITFGRRFLGPHYYLGLLIPASVLAGHGLAAIVEHRRRLGYLTGATLLAVTAAGYSGKIRENQHPTEIARAEATSLRDTVTGKSLVLLPRSDDGAYLLHPRGSLGNHPDLEDRVLYAVDRSEQNIDLFERFPDRSIYRLQQSEGPQQERHYSPSVRRLQLRNLAQPTAAHIASRNNIGAPVAQLYATIGLDRVQCTVDRTSTRGATYYNDVTISAQNVTLHCPDAAVTLPRTDVAATLAVGIAFGPDDNLSHAHLYEYRYWSRAQHDQLTIIEPPEQWRRDPEPQATWTVTECDTAVAITLTTTER
jgi:hypothetical protein